MEWGDRKRKLSDALKNVTLLPNVVVQIVTEYCAPVEWNNKPFNFWSLPDKGRPRGLSTDGKHILICDSRHSCLRQYSLMGSLIDSWLYNMQSTPSKILPPAPITPITPTTTHSRISKWLRSTSSVPVQTTSEHSPPHQNHNHSTINGNYHNYDNNHIDSKEPPIALFKRPYAIDINSTLNYLYIMDEYYIKVLTFGREILCKWSLIKDDIDSHSNGLGTGLCVKIDFENIYATIDGYHQIFIYNVTGELIKKYGKEKKRRSKGSGGGLGDGGSTNGTQCGENEFQQPYGLTFDKKDLYICDCRNHRIQVLNKVTGIYSHQWGSKGSGIDGCFNYPRSIHLSEGLCYVGDDEHVQLFTTQGIFLQRLRHTLAGQKTVEGQFHDIGLVVVGDKLFVSNELDNRIQVFRTKD